MKFKIEHVWIPIYVGYKLYPANSFEVYTGEDRIREGAEDSGGTIIESTDDLIIILYNSDSSSDYIENCVVYQKLLSNFDFELIEKAILKFKIKSIP
jgi:hypothetical protein